MKEEEVEEEKEKEEKEERRRRRQRLTKMTRMSRVSPGGAGGGCLERERQPTLASANTLATIIYSSSILSLCTFQDRRRKGMQEKLCWLKEQCREEYLESRVALSSSTLERLTRPVERRE